MNNRKFTKWYDFTKYFFQCLLILIEFGGISVLFVHITSSVVQCNTVVDYLERAALGLALYEFVLFVVLEAINDGQKDSLIALQTAYRQAILACEENSEMLFARVNQYIDEQLDDGKMNTSQVRKEYKDLRVLISRKDLTELKYQQIRIDHCCNAAALRWRFTLLLRLFK